MFAEHPPLTIRPDGSLFQLKWLFQMWRNCTAARYAVNKERMVRISSYSQQCLKQLRSDTGIQYEGRTRGTLQVFRSEEHTSELQSLMRISYAVFCLKKKT